MTRAVTKEELLCRLHDLATKELAECEPWPHEADIALVRYMDDPDVKTLNDIIKSKIVFG
jgi:hypothetical protein